MIMFQFYDVCFKPLPFGVLHIKPIIEVERHPSLPLLQYSIRVKLHINPFIIFSCPTSKMYFDLSTSFLLEYINENKLLTAVISPLHHFPTESKQSTCSPILNSVLFTRLRLELLKPPFDSSSLNSSS